MADTGQVVLYKDGYKINADEIAVEVGVSGAALASANFDSAPVGGFNVTTVTEVYSRYQRIGNAVIVTGMYNVTPTAGGGAICTWNVSPPFDQSSFTGNFAGGGGTAWTVTDGSGEASRIAFINATTVQMQYPANSTNTGSVRFTYMYFIDPLP